MGPDPRGWSRSPWRSRLRASDGANLGTFPAGDGPNAVAFDGANIWVANSVSGNVTRLSLVK